jgi:integrase
MTNKILRTLGAVMKYAVRSKYVTHNPLKEIERPKGRCEIESDADEDLQVYQPAEIPRLLDAALNEKHKTVLMLAVMSGLREGELIGLKWTDIDWINKQVQVRRSCVRGVFYKPKTKTSRRNVDIGLKMIAQLRSWKVACPPNKLDLVFPSNAGTPLDGCHLMRRVFAPAAKRAGLKRIRFHDLRHTYASIQIEKDVHPKYLQAQLGHSSIKVTLDVYGHLMKGSNPEAANAMEDEIFGTTGSKTVAKR